MGLLKAYGQSKYYKGKSDCEAAQVDVDNGVKDIIPEVQSDLKDSDEQNQTERVEIHKSYTTGLTLADVELARNQGRLDGERNGRKEVYNEIRENGGCLAIKYEPNDKLFINAKSQQQRFLKSGIGSYGTSDPEAELPRSPETDAIPESLAGEYPQPD